MMFKVIENINSLVYKKKNNPIQKWSLAIINKAGSKATFMNNWHEKMSNSAHR